MPRYVKKPIEIEAIRWNGLNLEEIKNFVGNPLIYEIFDNAWKLGKGRPMVEMKIKTLEGIMTVSEGDYIIKGIQGEFYPCKPNIFEKTYEIATDNADVVPRSEVERLTIELEAMRGSANLYKMHYEQAQAEKDNLIATYEACMKTYAEQLFEGIEDIAVMCYHDGLLTEKQAIVKILELKKKYIGEVTENE